MKPWSDSRHKDVTFATLSKRKCRNCRPWSRLDQVLPHAKQYCTWSQRRGLPLQMSLTVSIDVPGCKTFPLRRPLESNPGPPILMFHCQPFPSFHFFLAHSPSAADSPPAPVPPSPHDPPLGPRMPSGAPSSFPGSSDRSEIRGRPWERGREHSRLPSQFVKQTAPSPPSHVPSCLCFQTGAACKWSAPPLSTRGSGSVNRNPQSGRDIRPSQCSYEVRWRKTTPPNCTFLSCGHLDFESAVTAQNDGFKGSFDSSYLRQNVAKKLST